MKFGTHFNDCDSYSGTEAWPQVWFNDFIAPPYDIEYCARYIAKFGRRMRLPKTKRFVVCINSAQQEVRYFRFRAFS